MQEKGKAEAEEKAGEKVEEKAEEKAGKEAAGKAEKKAVEKAGKEAEEKAAEKAGKKDAGKAEEEAAEKAEKKAAEKAGEKAAEGGPGTEPSVPEYLKAFGYQGVTLKKSRWERQRARLIETYLAIDNGDLLHYFRELAGIPDRGTGLAGWYGANACTFGQKLGALAHLYLVTGDERLREKALYLAEEWGRCAEASQKLYDVNDTYVYDKLMGGFLDLYEALGYERALTYVKGLTESAARRFKRDIKRDGLQDAALAQNAMIEWYTLPEQLYRAYRLTGDTQYLNFAREWDYPYFFEKLEKKDFAVGPRHAYSHVNSLCSAARAYEATGDRKYLTAVKNGYEEILAHHTFATGGYGPAECLFPEEKGYLGDSLKPNWDKGRLYREYRNFGDAMVTRDDTWGSCEVSCCAWAVFKLTGYLMRFTGEARYGDWAEKLLYNGCGGQPDITPEGKVMYYANYFLDGGIKTVEDRRLQDSGVSFEWQCCTGTFPEDVAEYANLLYYTGEDGLYIAQYLPSEARLETQEGTLRLENISQYPQVQQLKFVVHTERGGVRGKMAEGASGCGEGTDTRPESRGTAQGIRTALHFRVPSWADGANEAKINGAGAAQAERIRPDTWLTLEREWQEGDVIELLFPFRLRFCPVDAYSPEIMALAYGPLVLVCDKMTVFQGDAERPEEWIRPSWREGYSVAFETLPGHVKGCGWLTRAFYPYYEVPELEWYYMYNRCEAPKRETDGTKVPAEM